MDKNMINHIKNFIKSRYLMVMGTANDGEPSVCTVWYVTSDAKTLYFKSRTNSNHMKVLIKNPKAAMVVYDHESNYSIKAGLQAIGIVERVKSLSEMANVVSMYGKAFQGASNKLTNLNELISDFTKSTMYKFTIKKIKMVDTGNKIQIDEYLDWA